MEEIAEEELIKRFDITRLNNMVTMDKEEDFLILRLNAHLSENRPSLLMGDKILVNYLQEPTEKKEGVIHEIREQFKILKCPQCGGVTLLVGDMLEAELCEPCMQLNRIKNPDKRRKLEEY